MDYEKIYNECIAAGESEVHELPEPTFSITPLMNTEEQFADED